MKNYTLYRPLRQKWYQEVRGGHHSVKEICRIFGISRKTYYKWRGRDLGPKQGYSPRKTHPHLKLTPVVRMFIEREKLKTNYGPLKMKYLVRRKLNLDLSKTIIYRFYRRKGLIRKPQKRLPWYQPLKERLIVQKPGQNIQMDVQYIWQGKFIYRFRLVDEFSRMQFFADAGSKDSRSAVKVFEQARKYFPFPILGIQTDNGSEFRGEFHQYLLENNITHRFIPKASAPWNGKVERAHGSMNQEYSQNSGSSFQEPEQYLEWYNFERIHLGINGLTPYEKYQEHLNLKSVTP